MGSKIHAVLLVLSRLVDTKSTKIVIEVDSQAAVLAVSRPSNRPKFVHCSVKRSRGTVAEEERDQTPMDPRH